MTERPAESELPRLEQLNEADIADEKPPKRCEWTDDYSRRCGNDAVKAVWVRQNSRVNEHGVWIDTEVRPVWVCEEHEHRGKEVPDAHATVVTR